MQSASQADTVQSMGPPCPAGLWLSTALPPSTTSRAEAKDCGGKPVAWSRNVKGRKHSKYAPIEGNRYDGIYKVGKAPVAASRLPPC